jgi:type 1 glutamine amidotransferase
MTSAAPFRSPTHALAVAFTLALGLTALPAAPRAAEPSAETAPRPIKALLVTGGCCHDYKGQKSIIPEGVSARARVEWTVIHEGDTREHKMSIYAIPGWAEGYDVVVHNECFGYVADKEFVGKIVAPHRDGLAAVIVHCSVHSYRETKSEDWHEFLGVTSRRHGRQRPLQIKNLRPEHPVMKGFPSEWATGNEELYVIEKVWPETVPLAEAKDVDDGRTNPVIWTHTYGKGRVFGTSLAHNDATVRDPVYLDLLTRGLLWATGKLDDNGKPLPGYEAGAPAKE